MLLWYNIKVVGTKATWWYDADIAQLVEHVIGNDEVISSNLIISSKKPGVRLGFFVIFSNCEKGLFQKQPLNFYHFAST